jgi:hypothetical protein
MKSLSELTKSITQWAEKETIKMQEDLVFGIRKDTPVDTGRAQAGWENENIKRLGDKGIIKNDVEYIGWLEFGTDKTQPHGMVRRNIKRVVGK